MQRVELSRHLNVPAERAYEFITDMRNWRSFFPGFIALDPTSRCGTAGDVARLTSKLMGRERRVEITFERFETNTSFAYSSRQDGLPVAHHERKFTPDRDGCMFDLAVAYEPRSGLQGLLDRVVLRAAVRRLLQRTVDALELVLT